ncbi:MAG: methyltransferase [Eudoraea sp.]|nr:methyltransferase [Eudoraea sp.]
MEPTVEKNIPTQKQADPSHIIQTGMGFWASKTLLTAVKMGLFTRLGKGPLPATRIGEKLGIHQRSLYDFLDALVALGFLNRRGFRETAIYSNTKETDLFLNKRKASYIGGILEMSNNRLYPFWNDLENALRTGQPQNEVKGGNKPFFQELYADEARLREFVSAMGGFQMHNFMAFSRQFDFSSYNTLCDIGGAGGNLATQVAAKQPHMHCITFDFPAVSVIARENIDRLDFNPRVKVVAGDFFKDPFPEADVITMGNILHDWGLEDKKFLISKAYAVLPEGGSLVVIENIIDDLRRQNAFGLLVSLNMLIETYEGFDYTAADFTKWVKEAGFRESYKMRLNGPTSAVVAVK